MFEKIVGLVGTVVKEVLVIIGLLALVVVWKLYAWLGGHGDEQKNAEPVPVVQTIRAPEAMTGVAVATDCACASGSECEGPRGGRYCLTDDGAKRYRARP